MNLTKPPIAVIMIILQIISPQSCSHVFPLSKAKCPVVTFELKYCCHRTRLSQGTVSNMWQLWSCFTFSEAEEPTKAVRLPLLTSKF